MMDRTQELQAQVADLQLRLERTTHALTLSTELVLLANQLRDEAVAEVAVLKASKAPKFSTVSCSQCGGQFGPGNSGFSHCRDHAGASSRLMSEAQEFMRERRADVSGFAREVHDELERMDMAIEEMKAAA